MFKYSFGKPFTPLPHLQVTLSVQESTLTRVQGTLRDAQEEVHSLRELVAQQKDELHAGEMERRQLHNTVQELKVGWPSGFEFSSHSVALTWWSWRSKAAELLPDQSA